MKDILTVFRFTLRDGARKKAFWVTTIIVLVLIVGICCVPRVMDLFSGGNASEPGSETPGTSVGEPAEKTEICYLIDEQQLIPRRRRSARRRAAAGRRYRRRGEPAGQLQGGS